LIERRTKLEVFGAKESKPTVAMEFLEENNLRREDEAKEEAGVIREQEAIFNALVCSLLVAASGKKQDRVCFCLGFCFCVFIYFLLEQTS
jgi:hypothetical protein